MKIAIAGASGFVGQHLIRRLCANPGSVTHIRALSRSAKAPSASLGASSQSSLAIESIACDLYSLKQTENALQGCDVAIYLVHSMLPSSQLTQGTFEDYDLILADNFLRAADKANIKHIIYLSGIIPECKGPLSAHLASRLEVEKCLQSSSIPTTSLRAGIVLGEDGSSFNMMFRLVQRLPAMICPAWTLSQSNPIDISDVAESIVYVMNSFDAGSHPQHRVYDLAGATTLSYRDMLQQTARLLGKRPLLIPFPLFTPVLSRLWVSLVTGAPRDLVYPLVESLSHSMTPDPKKTLQIPNWQYKGFEQSLRDAAPKILKKQIEISAFRKRALTTGHHIVQSLQRFVRPPNWNAIDVSRFYMDWLDSAMPFLIRVQVNNGVIEFCLRLLSKPLLKLEYSDERSVAGRVLFYIRGGLLANSSSTGRFEFRETFDRQYIMAAIHQFRPRLPWFIYKYTQALVHLYVMRKFGAALARVSETQSHKPKD